MLSLLQFFLLLPLAAFLLSLLLPRKEKLLSGLAVSTAGLHLAGILAFIIYWLVNGSPLLDSKHLVFFKGAHIEIFIDLYFDKATAVFAFVGSLLTLLVSLFSRYYLHREEGYKRFFSTLLLFFLGYNLVIFAGNFETLFIGWEILGICSFLLIAFYRDRYLPVKNGMKVISVYRLGDICLILAMWMSHQLWHRNITFFEWNDAALVQAHLAEHQGYGLFIAVMIVVAAVIKSAQFPFSSWLPRAMEGPTTSSAIFYGSLSVHLGAFLLLRTWPYWESIGLVKISVVVVGLVTSIIAATTARVQSSVKTQIAYSSITQIGIIFIEVALGFHVLALVHFAGNAFLRTYQLLVSPSVLSYLIHDMVFRFKPAAEKPRSVFINRLRNSFYMLSIKEWQLDAFLFKVLWNPFKWTGNRLRFMSSKAGIAVIILLLLAGIFSHYFPANIPAVVLQYLPHVFAAAGLLMVLQSFTERASAMKAWSLLVLAQLFITFSVALFHEGFETRYILIFLSGILVAAITGFICLSKMSGHDKELDLNSFHGHVYEHPWNGFVFLLCCLALVGLPFTPTFIGIDILFSHIPKGAYLLIVLVSLSFVFIELAVIRIYARIFLGQHKKTYHPIAYRSS